MADDQKHTASDPAVKGKHAAASTDSADVAAHASTGADGKAPSNSGGKRVALIVVLVVCLVVAACGIGLLVWNQVSIGKAVQQAQDTATPSTQPIVEQPNQQPQEQTPQPAQNPIDFGTLKLENPDIYAWVYIPNTQVNYPIVQHPTDDFYYLTHDVDGNANGVGAIYTEMQTATDFSDPVTVVYGHNIAGDLMFATLHYFENEEFFNNNQTMYVYRPGHILTYTIVAAYQYDDRHILNSFDFTNPTMLQSYYDMVQNPESMLVNERAGVQLTASDTIIQLSTCMTNYSHTNTRYIVTGVLTDDQQTQ